MGDVQYLGLGCAYAYERAASRDLAHGAMAVFAPVERMGKDVLDRLRAPRAATWRGNAGTVEGHSGGVKRTSALDRGLAPAHDNWRGSRGDVPLCRSLRRARA